MKRYQNIIIVAALDDRDATTIQHAAHFARAAQANAVYVVHVSPSLELSSDEVEAHPDLRLPIDEEIEQRLRATVQAHTNLFAPATQVHYAVRQGSLVSELVRFAAQKSGDLLCVGRQPVAVHDALSASAVTLVRKAPCSVFIVPASIEPRFKRILVPIVFTPRCRESLEVAVAIAGQTPGASIVVQNVYSVPIGYHKTGRTYEDFASSMRKLVERQWGDFLPQVAIDTVPWSIRFDLGNKVAGTILAVAQEMDAELIVIGSHGRTRPAGVLLGHVAESVCGHTSRPVLCVKNKGEVVDLIHAMLQLFNPE